MIPLDTIRTEQHGAVLVARITNPPSDLNGDADYRRHLAGVLTARAVRAAMAG